jgi:hypothetical protein
VIAIVQTIRLILSYIQRQLNRQGNTSRVLKWLLCCMQCCFACVEKFLKFLNKNAYIEIAVYGYSFCEASKMAFQLLTRNAIRSLHHLFNHLLTL